MDLPVVNLHKTLIKMSERKYSEEKKFGKLSTLNQFILMILKIRAWRDWSPVLGFDFTRIPIVF